MHFPWIMHIVIIVNIVIIVRDLWSCSRCNFQNVLLRHFLLQSFIPHVVLIVLLNSVCQCCMNIRRINQGTCLSVAAEPHQEDVERHCEETVRVVLHLRRYQQHFHTKPRWRIKCWGLTHTAMDSYLFQRCLCESQNYFISFCLHQAF